MRCRGEGGGESDDKKQSIGCCSDGAELRQDATMEMVPVTRGGVCRSTRKVQSMALVGSGSELSRQQVGGAEQVLPVVLAQASRTEFFDSERFVCFSAVSLF